MTTTLRHLRKTDFIWLILGTALMALSTNLFYAPAKMIPGGFTGLAIIIRELTPDIYPGGIPLWLSNIVLNVPLILLSVKLRGWKFIRRTFFAAVLFSVHLFWVPELSICGDDPLLSAVYGGVLMGIGLGLVFFGRATTGGTDTLAALLQKVFPYFSVAQIMPVLDGLIIVGSAFIFGLNTTLYVIISVVLAGWIADRITSGFKASKMALIISDNYDAISKCIMLEMDRGVTKLEGIGMYTGTSKPVLMCAVAPKEIVTLRSIVADIDKDAFMILTNATEVRGEGFMGYNVHEEL